MRTATVGRTFRRSAAACVLWAGVCGASAAENFTDYPSLEDPLLLLLRKPAVVRDRELDANHRRRLGALNRRFDSALLSPPAISYVRSGGGGSFTAQGSIVRRL